MSAPIEISNSVVAQQWERWGLSERESLQTFATTIPLGQANEIIDLPPIEAGSRAVELLGMRGVGIAGVHFSTRTPEGVDNGGLLARYRFIAAASHFPDLGYMNLDIVRRPSPTATEQAWRWTRAFGGLLWTGRANFPQRPVPSAIFMGTLIPLPPEGSAELRQRLIRNS